MRAEQQARDEVVSSSAVYEGAPYHRKTDNSEKSRRWTNPQVALSRSVQVSPTSGLRVGVDPTTKEFSVFMPTANNVYHGHVRRWKDLEQPMKNALTKAGLTDRKGNILAQENKRGGELEGNKSISGRKIDEK